MIQREVTPGKEGEPIKIGFGSVVSFEEKGDHFVVTDPGSDDEQGGYAYGAKIIGEGQIKSLSNSPGSFLLEEIMEVFPSWTMEEIREALRRRYEENFPDLTGSKALEKQLNEVLEVFDAASRKPPRILRR